jgi:hypothetical protein
LIETTEKLVGALRDGIDQLFKHYVRASVVDGCVALSRVDEVHI